MEEMEGEKGQIDIETYLDVYHAISKTNNGKGATVKDLEKKLQISREKINEAINFLLKKGFLVNGEGNKYHPFFPEKVLHDYSLIKSAPCFTCELIHECNISDRRRSYNCSKLLKWLNSL